MQVEHQFAGAAAAATDAAAATAAPTTQALRDRTLAPVHRAHTHMPVLLLKPNFTKPHFASIHPGSTFNFCLCFSPLSLTPSPCLFSPEKARCTTRIARLGARPDFTNQ